jgi:predicted Fe-Mo cluster-binding NifX family protein
MQDGRIAIPSVEKGGLDGTRSGHFGHCDVFTLVDVEGGEIKEVTTVANQEHVQGGQCLDRWRHWDATPDGFQAGGD